MLVTYGNAEQAIGNRQRAMMTGPLKHSLLDEVDAARVCQALAPFIADERRARIDAVLAARLAGVTVVLENLHDPHNGAAALRSCEAAGLVQVHVVEATERFQFSQKVTQGCERWLEIVRHHSTGMANDALRGTGFLQLVALPDAETSLDRIGWRAG